MKKQISFALIILALFLFTISYASENEAYKGIAYESDQVDSIPRVTKAVKPNFSLNSRIGVRGDDLLEDINEGRVILRLVVTMDGNVRDPEVVESTPPNVFDEYALKTIMEYRFKPAMKDGKPVDFIVKLPMEFKIPHKNSSYAAYKARVSGRKFFQTGEYDKAIEAYTEAIKIDGDYSGYYSDRCKTYIELGEFNKAASDISRAIKLAPDESSYYIARSDVYMKLEDTKNMCLDLKKACDLGDCSGFEQAKAAGKCN